MICGSRTAGHPCPDIPDYDCFRYIGAGGFGEVWLARRRDGGCRAVKVIRREARNGKGHFDRELKAIKEYETISHRHPALIEILHVGTLDGGLYYVMHPADSLSGRPCDEDRDYEPKTLASELRFRKIPPSEAAHIAVHLLGGLEIIHGHGLVHRDIKPDNVIYRSGLPVLADIGLLSRISEVVSASGTPGYVPREGAGKPQADIYAMGMLLYVMMSGNPPGEFPTAPTIKSRKMQQLFAQMNAITLRACHDDASRRFRSAAAMRNALCRLLPGRHASAVAPVRIKGSQQAASRAGKVAAQSKAGFKRSISELIQAKATVLMRRRSADKLYLSPSEFAHLTVQVCAAFKTTFGVVPNQVRAACKLSEVVLAPTMVEQIQLLRAAIGIGGGLSGIGIVVGGIGLALGWGQGAIAAVTAFFMGSSVAWPITLIMAGSALAGIAVYFSLSEYDPVTATARALNALESSVLAATDQTWGLLSKPKARKGPNEQSSATSPSRTVGGKKAPRPG